MGDRLAGTMAGILENYGSGGVGNADKTPVDDLRIPTGSVMLDATLGGGLPAGRVSVFWGAKSGGKTTTAKRIVGIAQGLCRRCLRPAKNVVAVEPPPEVLKDNPKARWSAEGECDCYREGLCHAKPEPPQKEKKEGTKDYRERVEAWEEAMKANSYEEYIVVWVDPEDAYDKGWAAKLGVDNRRLQYIRTETAEEASDISAAIAGSTFADMLVIDSLAHFTPRAEIEASAEDWQQGLAARIVNKSIRRWISGSVRTHNASGTTGITQIWINQVRMKIGITFGDPAVKPAGLGQDYAGYVEVRFLSGKVEVVKDQYGSKDEKVITPVKETFSWKVLKNKTFSGKKREGTYEMALQDIEGVHAAGDITEMDQIMKLVWHFGIAEKKGQKYVFAEQEFTSQAAVKNHIADDPEVFAATRRVVMERIMRGR